MAADTLVVLVSKYFVGVSCSGLQPKEEVVDNACLYAVAAACCTLLEVLA